MRHFCKRALALILTITLIFGTAPAASFAAGETEPHYSGGTEPHYSGGTGPHYNDTSGHWASDAIERWSDYGVLSGYAGMFRPGDPITRAEMAAVLQRVSGYAAAGENPFSDVTAGKWYYSDVLKLAAAGIMTGYNGKARPEDHITREEAATLMSRAFDMHENAADPKPFSDTANISPWAAGFVRGLHAAGYITGKPGNRFDPKANITKAEVVTILDNMVKGFYNAPGEYGGDVTGNAVIRTGGVTLKDVQISRDLYLMEGIGGGDAVLDHVTVAKTTHIHGGGANSIHVTGGDLGAVEMNSLTNPRLVLSADTKVSNITILNSGTVTHNGVTVTLDAVTGSLTLGGMIDKAVLNADGSMTVTVGGVTYEIMPPAVRISTLTLSAGSVVKELSLNGPLQINGTGRIDKTNILPGGAVIGGSGSGNNSGGGSGGNTVKVTYETFGEPQIAPSTVAKGSTLTAVPQPVRSGDAFAGWYTDAGLTEPFDAAQPLNQNMTLYADWAERDNHYQEYAESDQFIDDCDPRHAVTVLSSPAPGAPQLTAANLADYILIEGTGQIPAFTVTDQGNGRFEIAPQADYEAGCLYTFSLKDAGLTFDGEDAAVRTLTIRPHKAETKVIDFNDKIIDVDWDDVSAYTVVTETGIGTMKVPALKYSGIKDAFRLNGANPEARTTIRIQDLTYSAEDENYRETEYRNITGLTEAGGDLTLQTENSQLVDVFDKLDVYLPNIEIDLDDYMAGLDMEALETQAAQSAGARQIGELLNASLAESPTIQGLLAEPAPALGAGPPSAADYGFKTPSRENEKKLMPGMFDTFLTLTGVKATTGETNNANFPAYGGGYFVTVEFGYSGTIKDKVQVDATFKVTEYMSIFAGLDAKYNGVWTKPRTWDDLEITCLSNIYSQTDITVDIIAKSVSKDPEYAYEIDVTEELTKLMNGDEDSGAGASAMLKKVLADQGEYVDLISLPMVETSIKIIPEAPVIEVEFELDFVIKASFAAGIHTDMTFLGARALGFYYNLDTGEKINYNLPFENYDNQYYIDLWAAGYFGVKAGLKGEVSVGVIGMKDIFDAGMSMELGVYADMWGLVHLQHYRHRYPYHKGSNVQGGLYFEVGIYLEMEVFVRSKVFGAEAGWKFLDAKWPVYTFGDRYLLLRFINSDARILTRGDLLLTGGAGLFDAEFIDLKTGDIVKGGEYANSKNFNVVIPSPYFEVDRTAEKVKIRKDKIGDPSVRPYLAPGTKTLSSAANIYYGGSTLAFGTHTVVPEGYEDLMYSQKGITLVWADPSLDIGNINDLKSYKATYYLDMDGDRILLDRRDVLVGQVPGAPVMELSGNFQYFTWKNLLEYAKNCVVKGVSSDFSNAITKDTEYVITAEKLQRLEAIVSHYGGRWHFDVYAVNCGETPRLPAGYDVPFGGWTAPVDWYIETGYPAVTLTAFDQLQPAGDKYELGQTADGSGMVSYRPHLAWVSGYPTDRPIYSYEYDITEDYTGNGLFNNYTAGAYVHKWKRPGKDFGPAQDIFGSWWVDNYDSRVSDRFGNFGADINWTRFYEYLYVAEYAQTRYTVTFNAGYGEFADHMQEYLDTYGRYSSDELIGTTMGLLAASAVVPPTDAAITYALTGWKDQDGKTYGLDESYRVMKNMDFTAVYTAVPDEYTITVYPIGETFLDGTGKKEFKGAYDAPTEPTGIDGALFHEFDSWTMSAGVGYEYAFDGWYSTAGSGEEKLTAWPAKFGASGKDARNIVIVAKIKRVSQQHTVTFNANGGTFPDGESTYTKVYEHGAVINPAEIPEPARASGGGITYTFAGWGLYGSLQPVTQDASYYALWDMDFENAALPEGIFISDGERIEDINSVNIGAEHTPIPGYKYELAEYHDTDPETGPFYIPTLTITGSGLTVSGSVSGGVSDIADMVALVIEDSVTDITFKDLSLTGLFEWADVIYTGGADPLTITVSGDCRIEKLSVENNDSYRSALCNHRDVLFSGADGNAALAITAENANAISAFGDLAFENLELTMDVSGVITQTDVHGDGSVIVPEMAKAFGGEGGSEMRFIDSDVEVNSPGSQIGGSVILEGSTDFEYVSTDASPALSIQDSLIFEDFEGTFRAYFVPAASSPAVRARDGILFTVDGLPADPEDYGVIVEQYTVGEGEDAITRYTFTDGNGTPLANVRVRRVP